jgi:molybdopterin synthase catalytic subunit
LEPIVREPIDTATLVREVSHPGAGAVLTFAGTVRDSHAGRRVVAIDYHAYEEMAASEIRRIELAIEARWPGLKARIAHRVGRLDLGELSVFLAVSAPHRAEAFEALRFGIETLKTEVPIWKQEFYTEGSAWIEGS